MKLEIEGRLRQASFCSVEMYDTDNEDEGFVEHRRSRKEAQSVLTEQSFGGVYEETGSQKLIKGKKKKVKNIGKSIKKGTLNIGSSLFGFLRFRSLWKRIKRTKIQRYQSQENLV